MALVLDGPAQRGQGVAGQYVYWMCMPYPTPENVAAHNVKTPDDFNRDSFRQVVLEVHSDNGAQLVETVCFLGPHASGKNHLNLLVRALAALWRGPEGQVAARLRPIRQTQHVNHPRRRRYVNYYTLGTVDVALTLVV